MTPPSPFDLQDAAERLQFGVGVWIRGKPHLTAQVAWDRRPSDDLGWSAVERLLEAHRRISAGGGGPTAQDSLRGLAESLDPRTAGDKLSGERLQQYQQALAAMA